VGGRGKVHRAAGRRVGQTGAGRGRIDMITVNDIDTFLSMYGWETATDNDLIDYRNKIWIRRDPMKEEHVASNVKKRETHFTLDVNYNDDILEDLLDALDNYNTPVQAFVFDVENNGKDALGNYRYIIRFKVIEFE
jgi:hypothetical protein